MSKPLLIVVSAPSGAGKSTLCDRLLDEFEFVVYSISCTTRDPRGEEEDGIDYYFVSDEGFEARVKEGAFLEHAVVHGNRYGTLTESVRMAMSEGQCIIMDIDVQGAEQLREKIAQAPQGDMIREGFLDIFISPPSLEALKDRLVGRGEDSLDVIETRLNNAADEMACSGEYKYTVVNDDLEQAYRELRGIILTARG